MFANNQTVLRAGGFGALLFLGGIGVCAQETNGRRPIVFDDLRSMHRVADPQISPNGKFVAYALATPDMDANRNASNIWIVPTTKGAALQLTQSGHDSGPAWSPDSKSLAFISSREGNPQVYVLSMEGGESHAVTHAPGGVDLVKWSPDGVTILFTSSVYPDCKDDACNSSRDSEKEKNKVKARVYEQLLYRHWTHWSEGKRAHLFVTAADGSGTARDLTPGANYDVPPDERGGAADVNFSPDGKEICFTAVADKVEALSTNGDLFLVPTVGGEIKKITNNPGFDGAPLYSPDGKFIAYHSQATPGNEADKWRVMLYDRQTGKSEDLSQGFDRSADGLAWSADSKSIYFNAENETLSPVYQLTLHGASENNKLEPRKIIPDGFNSALSVAGDGNMLAFERSSLSAPPEVFVARADGSHPTQLSHHNDALLATLDINAAETFWFEGAAGAKVQAMIVRPPKFDATKKYPLLVLLHGGPQTMWGNSWGYRWNAQIFSSAGYVCLMINRRGSTGYGQKFTDQITNDWGGLAYVDVMKGIDHALAKYNFIDGARMAAAGGSYGGFMADWIATHNGRFKAIISHAGVYDQTSMYATEELWFAEHDMQGTPWANGDNYKKSSASTYAGELGKYKTPTLVIAGENDFRVPYTQSLEFFNTLQRQGVPSKLVIFPDEGHWILKPQNSQFWYKTFLDWLGLYLK